MSSDVQGISVDTDSVHLPLMHPKCCVVMVRTAPFRTVYVSIVEGDRSLAIASHNAFVYRGFSQAPSVLRLVAPERGVISLQIGPATRDLQTTIKVNDFMGEKFIVVRPYPVYGSHDHASSN